ncbi:MAG: hypothetical protein E7F77_04375 [Serratia marcescens]|uniref:hypothetical protein n=1 Tax=Serratia marcescens TaxID=615 RepID=UPI0021777518|nr:hypothetical protein [Serratia marcescens]MDU3570045.1 hypothetical protein [Serratia marcescens]MDU3648344.1 hypothetical protein [Serratia marcescens]CAI0809721.1 Uncharacterised protein [Serratia marcescens]CAI1575281.1 Uncharacterised protein [Serratia marcescens]
MKMTFWNSGIKATKGNRGEYSYKILDAVNSIFISKNSDVVFMCEVDREFTSSPTVLGYLNEKKINIIDACDEVKSRVKFDICAMYDPVKIDVKLEKYIVYNNLHDELEHTGNNIKVGVIFTLKYKESIESNCVAVIVSHWPSKITPGYEFRHKEAAEKLRDTAQDLIKDGFQVVLIGDYNLSPDEIIKDTPLQSYNNKFFATRSSLRLYNLGFHFLEQHSVCCRKINIPLEHAHGFGTFISSSNRAVETGCATFDYAHVGSSLIKDGPWIINEEDTRIFANQEIIDMIYGNASHLDHLPIIVSLMEKKNEQ